MNNKLDLLFEGGESSITIGQLHQNISESLKRNGFVDVIDDQVVVLVALVLEELDEGETGKITRERMERKIGECEKFRKLLDFLDDEGGVAVNVEGGLNSPLVEIPSDGEEEEGGKGKEKEKVIEIEMENVKVDETTYSKGGDKVRMNTHRTDTNERVRARKPSKNTTKTSKFQNEFDPELKEIDDAGNYLPQLRSQLYDDVQDGKVREPKYALNNYRPPPDRPSILSRFKGVFLACIWFFPNLIKNEYYELAADSSLGIVYFVWLLLTVGYYVLGCFVAVYKDPDIYDAVGVGFPAAVGAKFTFFLNIPLLFLLMCRSIMARMTWLCIFNNYHIFMHVRVAWMCVIMTIVHIGAHISNFIKIEKVPVDVYNDLLGKNASSTPTAAESIFTTGTGWTGIVATACFLIILLTSATRWLRGPHYHRFYLTHHLFIIMVVSLCIHGAWQLYLFPILPWVMIPALGIYIADRVLQRTRDSYEVVVQDSSVDQEDIISLKVQPKKNCRYEAGQYAFLAFDQISKFSHPFTVTSSPADDDVTFHIRAVGNWTGSLKDLTLSGERGGGGEGENSEMGKVDWGRIRMTGMFGGVLQAVRKYEVVVLIGAGVGATPFASILKDMWLHARQEIDETCYRKQKTRSKSSFNVQKNQKVSVVDDEGEGEGDKKLVGRRKGELMTYFFWMNRSPRGFGWMTRLLNDIEFLNDRKLFEARMFLTRAKDKFKPQNFFFLYASSLYLDTFGVDVVTSLPNHPQWGRPKWSQVFEEIARSHENSKIGVFICGPTLLTHEVLGVVKKFEKKHENLSFTVHKETFGY